MKSLLKIDVVMVVSFVPIGPVNFLHLIKFGTGKTRGWSKVERGWYSSTLCTRSLLIKRPDAIANPLKNHGTAYTLEEQAARAYAQVSSFRSDLEKYNYLSLLHQRNEVLYFKVIGDHPSEMSPIVYDPAIGEAIEHWSENYRTSRAIYLSIDHRDDIRASFETLGVGKEDVDLIVCSDAEEILGIGDWGVNGTEIAVGKLAIYTAAAGIHPDRVIAVNLDCGTDNEALLNSPSYLGNRHARVRGEAYDGFIADYLAVVADMFPQALLHFEDFGPANARRIIVDHGEKYRIFNDDMQSTDAIVMSAVMSGMKVTRESFADQRLVVYGAGTAGTGLADQISAAMVRDGLSEEEARARVWLIDKNGLVLDDMEDTFRTTSRPTLAQSGNARISMSTGRSACSTW